MNDKQKLLYLYHEVHGYPTLSCSVSVVLDEWHKPIAVALMKDGRECGRSTKLDIMWDYLTDNLDEGSEYRLGEWDNTDEIVEEGELNC